MTMSKSGTITSSELVTLSNTNESLAKEWLANQVARGFIQNDHINGIYFLPPEDVMVLEDEDSL